MKIHPAIYGCLAAALVPALLSAQPAPPAPPAGPAEQKVRKEIRVRVAHPGGPREKSPFLGVAVEPASPAMAAQLKLPKGSGLVVVEVTPDSPAKAAGIERHDVLVKLDDQILVNPPQLRVLVGQHKEGEEVSLTLLRAGESRVVKAKLVLGELPPHRMRGLPPGHPPIGGKDVRVEVRELHEPAPEPGK